MSTSSKTQERATLADKIVKLVTAKSYGETISHETLETLIGTTRSSEYYFIVTRANKILLSNKKMLRNVPGVGYEILEPNEYYQHSGNVFRNSFRKMNHSKKILENAPVELMSEEARVKHTKTYDRVCHYTGIVESGVKEIRKIRRATVEVTQNERIR